MKIKRIIFSEGAGYIHAICQAQQDAVLWLDKFRKNSNYKSVEMHEAKDVQVGIYSYSEPYRFVVSAEKHGIWFSSEFPFRAGLGMLLRNTVMSSTDESKLIASGIMHSVND